MTEAHPEVGSPLVSVIILNYNGLRFAEQCIRSVLESDYPNFEVIVVDNGSTDDSYEVICRFATVPKLEILRMPRNLGFAEGNNVGYRNSHGDIVVFLNVDTRVDRQWLARLVSGMVSDDLVGGAQCKLLDMKNRGAVDSVGSFLDSLGYVYPNRSESFDRNHEIFYADGAAMAFKRKVLNEVAFDGAPFDNAHFLYYEDTDLCWRVRLRGYKIVLVSSSIVHHYRGGAGAQDLQHVRTFYFTASHFFTLIKNYDLANLAWQFTVLFFVELVHSAALLPREPRRALAKFKAILWCLQELRNAWVRRVFVQSRVRRVRDREITRLMRRPSLFAARAASSVFY